MAAVVFRIVREERGFRFGGGRIWRDAWPVAPEVRDEPEFGDAPLSPRRLTIRGRLARALAGCLTGEEAAPPEALAAIAMNANWNAQTLVIRS